MNIKLMDNYIIAEQTDFYPNKETIVFIKNIIAMEIYTDGMNATPSFYIDFILDGGIITIKVNNCEEQGMVKEHVMKAKIQYYEKVKNLSEVYT